MSKKVNLESDSKYRAYTSAIDKCLKSFEYSNEWADLIASLGRLIKVSVICLIYGDYILNNTL